MTIKRVEILGVPVDCVDMSQAVAAVDNALKDDAQSTVLAVNAEKVLRAREDSQLLNCLQNAGLLIPDGVGAVFAMRILHGQSVTRVPGVELMPLICECAERSHASVFLFGATAAVNAAAREKLETMFPDLRIAGNRDGYVNEAAMPSIVKDINNSGADVVFVALGSPRQELWIEKHRDDLNAKLIQGVGGSFDVLSGHVKRAPAFFRKTNLEWLYRVISQPSKLPRGWISIKFGIQVLYRRLLPDGKRNM